MPEGVWNPTPHGLHLANMLLRLDFTGMHVLELGTGSGLHAILLARRGAARMTLTEIEPAISANARHNPRPQRHQDSGGVRHRRLDGGAGCVT